jgi:hypothetical protein
MEGEDRALKIEGGGWRKPNGERRTWNEEEALGHGGTEARRHEEGTKNEKTDGRLTLNIEHRTSKFGRTVAGASEAGEGAMAQV